LVVLEKVFEKLFFVHPLVASLQLTVKVLFPLVHVDDPLLLPQLGATVSTFTV